MDNTLICPSCGETIEITSAFKKDIEAKLKHDLEKHYTAQIDAAKASELKLLKEKQILLDREKDLELTIAKRLDLQRQEVEAAALKRAGEMFHLKEAEKDKIISDLKTSLEDAQRKATQGSQQLRGEVQELDLEQLLQNAFRDDDIEPIGKGVNGADIRQVVKTQKGTICGTILWESKRTKSWSDGWVGKLKQDMLRDKADLGAIVTEVAPEGVNQIGQVEGLHVCLPELTLPMAGLLRKILIDVARQKFFSDQKQDKAGAIYSYITGSEFSQTVESLITTYRDMQDQLTQERTAFERIWKRREAQIQTLLNGVGGIYGHLQGVAGTALPPVSGLELPE